MRRFVLTVHVVLSVGYLGVASVLATTSLAAFTAGDPGLAVGIYRTAAAALPLLHTAAVGALATGILVAVGTPWGLLRHWWVTVKLVLTIVLVATGFLVIRSVVDTAVVTGVPSRALVGSSTAHTVMACLATVLSVYKPWGRTDRRAGF